MEIVIRGLAEASSNPLATRDYDRLQELLLNLKALDSDIYSATLLNNQGRALASNLAEISGQSLSMERPGNAKDLASGVTLVDTGPNVDDYELRCPIKLFDTVMGQLRLGVSSKKIHDLRKSIVIINLAVGLATIVLGIVAYTWIIRVGVNRPIQELGHASREVSRDIWR